MSARPYDPSAVSHDADSQDAGGVAPPISLDDRRRARAASRTSAAAEAAAVRCWSTWDAATHGPGPFPSWLVTDPAAVDDDLGVLRTGKEADVSVVRRTAPDGRTMLLAAKRYRAAEHRMFHRDAGYTEGRRVRKSRETRAMAHRTAYGRELHAGQWAVAEFEALSRLWSLGAPVPYPVQLLKTELMLEFVGDADGTAAPRLAQVRPGCGEAADLFAQTRAAMRLLADNGYAHGDLSAYNLLVHQERVILVDLPQIVDVVTNPQGLDYLHRDCVNVCRWFGAHGVEAADAEELFSDLMTAAVSHW